MDSLPPNDPNQHNQNISPKTVPSRVGSRQSRNGPRMNERGEVEVFGGGNLGDDVMIAVMLLIGAAAWILREICVCR